MVKFQKRNLDILIVTRIQILSVVEFIMNLKFLLELPCFLPGYIYFERFKWEVRACCHVNNPSLVEDTD